MKNKNASVTTAAVKWLAASHGEIPQGAVFGGCTPTGDEIYIGRTRIRENRNELTPGIVIPSKKCITVPFGTGVRKSSVYEVLVAESEEHYHWLRCKRGEVPNRAVIGGIDCSYLEPLYIGRTAGNLSHGRTWRGQRFPIESDPEEMITLPGKVHGSHKCLYIPYDEKEYLFREYEVLTLTTTPAKLKVFCKNTLRSCLKTNGDETATNFADKVDTLPLPMKLREFILQDGTNI